MARKTEIWTVTLLLLVATAPLTTADVVQVAEDESVPIHEGVDIGYTCSPGPIKLVCFDPWEIGSSELTVKVNISVEDVKPVEDMVPEDRVVVRGPIGGTVTLLPGTLDEEIPIILCPDNCTLPVDNADNPVRGHIWFNVTVGGMECPVGFDLYDRVQFQAGLPFYARAC